MEIHCNICTCVDMKRFCLENAMGLQPTRIPIPTYLSEIYEIHNPSSPTPCTLFNPKVTFGQGPWNIIQMSDKIIHRYIYSPGGITLRPKTDHTHTSSLRRSKRSCARWRPGASWLGPWACLLCMQPQGRCSLYGYESFIGHYCSIW